KGEEVFTISSGGLSCVVSKSPIKKWELSRKNLISHEKVNEELLKNNVVLPIKFCTISESREAIVEKFLKRKKDTLLKKINYLADKHEYGLKAFWSNKGHVLDEILNENPALKKQRDRLATLPFQKARNEIVTFGEKLKIAFQQKRELLGKKIMSKLQLLSVEVKTNNLLADLMVLNGVFLVAKEKQTDFDLMVNELAKEHAEAMFKYVGPTPPANFVEIVVQW
ncbi:MAG: GvpL/GvpF family gas vesicle protein, partial [Chlamydiota bacterium]